MMFLGSDGEVSKYVIPHEMNNFHFQTIDCGITVYRKARKNSVQTFSSMCSNPGSNQLFQSNCCFDWSGQDRIFLTFIGHS